MGCSKSLYIYKQAVGQIALEWNGQENQTILEDAKVNPKIKSKIQNIIKYKKYFFQYFNQKPTSIYDQTTFLKQDAVTYLVIAAPYNKIEPLIVSFPIVGGFPYLGFFNKKDALEYKIEKENEGLDTYVRPVYAYSTLNQWIYNDNILSSFFSFDEHDLAELIFHELTHTIFFVKNEVTFNESLAQYIGERMTEEYFNYSENRKNELQIQKVKRKEYGQLISQFAKDMNFIYQQEKLSKSQAKEKLQNYLQTTMQHKFNAFCGQYKITSCNMIDEDWNNARLAAYLTYQNEQNLIELIHKKYNFSVKKLLDFFEKKYKVYKSINTDLTFTKFLKKEENL